MIRRILFVVFGLGCIAVYYNPANPEEACLQRSYRGMVNLTIGGAAIALFGLLFLVLPYLLPD